MFKTRAAKCCARVGMPFGAPGWTPKLECHCYFACVLMHVGTDGNGPSSMKRINPFLRALMATGDHEDPPNQELLALFMSSCSRLDTLAPHIDSCLKPSSAPRISGARPPCGAIRAKGVSHVGSAGGGRLKSALKIVVSPLGESK